MVPGETWLMAPYKLQSSKEQLKEQGSKQSKHFIESSSILNVTSEENPSTQTGNDHVLKQSWIPEFSKPFNILQLF